MPAYHSTLNELHAQEACGCAVLPIKTRARGPAPPAPEGQDDIVDEILTLFRANVLFTNFEIKGSADRVLIYGRSSCIFVLRSWTDAPTRRTVRYSTAKSQIEGEAADLTNAVQFCSVALTATRILQQTAVDTFAIPGDSSFPLGGMVRAPSSAGEAGW